MAQLIVGLTPTLARALARGDRTTASTTLRDITARAGIELQPQQADRDLDPTDDEDRTGGDEPTVWFWADTGGDRPTEGVDAQLLRVPGVTAAYVTPDQGPP